MMDEKSIDLLKITDELLVVVITHGKLNANEEYDIAKAIKLIRKHYDAGLKVIRRD